MKTIQSHTLLSSVLGAALVTALSAPVFAMDPDEAEIVRYGWKPQVEAVPYEGTSLTVSQDGELGFDDPRAGDSSYSAVAYQGTSLRSEADGELGFTDPRPGDSSY
jgi:hypothetical protein